MNSTNMVQQKHNYQSRRRSGRAGDPRVGLLRELADPLRLRVGDRLGHRGPETVSQLAGELAVPLPQLSNHLRRLREAGLVRVERRGRQAVYQLGDPGLETLLPLLDRITGHLRPLAGPSLAASRTCYDHLAGKLGVALADAMTERGLLDWSEGIALTPSGTAWLDELGIVVEPRRGRPAVRSCLDVTERRPHLAGAVGAALCAHALDQGWVRHIPGGRALKVSGSVREFGLPVGVVRELQP